MITTQVGSSLRLLATLGVDLTGLTVGFAFVPVTPSAPDSVGVAVDLSAPAEQVRAAVVEDAANGKASYTLTAADTATPGMYRAQFRFTQAGVEKIFPAQGWLDFVVTDFAAPSSFSALTDFCEPVRAIMGDFRAPYKFTNDAIAAVVRTVVRMGHVPGFGITSNGHSVFPAVTNACDLARLVYHSALTLLRPNAGGFAWKTRAMSIKRDGQEDFLFELQNIVYYTDNPTQLASFQSYYHWVNSLAGVNVWSLMSEMRVQGPVATVSIGASGVTVNTK